MIVYYGGTISMSKLIVIEGLDGCGKTTQLEMLKEKFPKANFITFPYYNTDSGRIVTDYLSGKFGEENTSVSAYSASAIYAVDRYTSYKTHWERLYKSENPLISARYVTSNAIYQMTKLKKNEWDGFLGWLFDFEYEKLGLPKPDRTIFLDMPIEVSQKLLTSRYNGDETKKDIHERDTAFLRACHEAALYTGEKCGWDMIPCSMGGEPRGIEEINKDLCRIIKETEDD